MSTARCTASVLSTLLLALAAGPSQAQSNPAQPAPSSPTASSSLSSFDQPPTPIIGSTVPTQILTAHTVFLTNMGADPNFPVAESAAFNDIYARLQGWGRYQLVSEPSQADLVLQLRDIAPISDVSGTHGDIATTTSPAFQLTVLDPKLNLPLYTLTSPVSVAGRGKTREHWISLAEEDLVSRMKVLSGQPLSATESADLLSVPKYHTARIGWILAGSMVGAAVAGGFLLHHEFENSLASQKASQDAFCEANHIPLSECAGG